MSRHQATTPPDLGPIVALKHAALSIQTGPFGSQLHAEDYSPGGRPVINPAHLLDGRIQPDDDCAVSESTFSELSQHELREGDIVVGRRGELGRCGVVTRDQVGWLCGTGSIRVRPDPGKLHPAWLRWLLAWSHSRDWLSLESVGSTMENLGAEVVGAMPIPLPPLQLQKVVAAYLDRETARLDGLVAAKERVLGLLAEKRRALITRGLDPRAPLRDSGIPWLGEIPSHWNVTQLKRAAAVIDCKHRTVPFVADGIPLASIREVQSWEIDLASAKMTTEDEYLLMIEGDRDPRPGDVIVSRNATVGAAALVPDGARFCMGQDVSLVRPQAGLEPVFLNWLFRGDGVANQISSASIGSTFLRINVEQIKELFIPLPKVEEQRVIAAHIATATARLDAVRSVTECTIALLKERRAALIAAAVTDHLGVTMPRTPDRAIAVL